VAVTGVFAADFSAFDKAVEGSQARLKGLEEAGGQVESSLRLMTQSQEQLLDKIGASGGKIQALGTTASETGAHVKTLTESYHQFDGILQAAGVNIGPQIKGLEDIANAAGKTAKELGAVGTAGAIAGAAFAGWKVGSWIADVTDLDEALANLVSTMMGWGEVSTDQNDRQLVINKAIEVSGHAVRSYADALKILKDANQEAADKQINWRDRLADSYRELRTLTDAQKQGIAIAQEAGATTEQITNKYGIHAQTLKLLADETDKAAEAQRKLTEARQKDLDAAAARQKANEAGVDLMNRDAALMADRAKFDAEQLAIQTKKLETGAAYVKQMGEIAAVNKSAADFDKTLATDAAALDVENQKLIASFGGMADAHTEAGAAAEAGTAATVAGYQAVAQQVEITSDGVKGWLELMRATNAANSLLNQNSLFTSSSTLENQARLGTAFSPIPGFASGIENFGGGLAKVHGGEVLANLPAGTSVFPKGGLGTSISNVFNLVDSESNLARRVSDLIMRQIRAGTQLGTA